jgi:hypothetical protein
MLEQPECTAAGGTPVAGDDSCTMSPGHQITLKGWYVVLQYAQDGDVQKAPVTVENRKAASFGQTGGGSVA